MSDVIRRVANYEGKKFGEKHVHNPHITARDVVELAEYIRGLKDGIKQAIVLLDGDDYLIDELITKLKGLIE